MMPTDWPAARSPFMPRGRPPIDADMSVSQVANGSSSYQSPAALEAERAVLVLKKSQDVVKAQGEALIALIEQSVPTEGVGTKINVYA
jgi:hypothetical protein